MRVEIISVARNWKRFFCLHVMVLAIYGLGCASTPTRRLGDAAHPSSSYEDVAALLNDCGALGNGYIHPGEPEEAVALHGCAMGARCDLPHSGAPFSTMGNGYATLTCAHSSCTCSIELDRPELRVEREVELDAKCTSDQQMVEVMHEHCDVYFYPQPASPEEGAHSGAR